MERSKYNVTTHELEKRTCNGILFDSVLEMKYYRDVVLPGVESGEITNYELQKKYILQDGFMRNGKKVLPIVYVADFYIEYKDGRIDVVDVKGCPDATAKIKRKLFWYRYPELNYIWVTYLKKFGGWGLYDDDMRRKRDLVRNQGGKESGEQDQESVCE